MKYLLLFLLISFTSIQSCKMAKEFSELTEDDVQLKISKGACYGSCPVYIMSIYDGGWVYFEGKRFTTKDGNWIKKLDKKTYSNLIEKFEASNFTSFQDEYESELADLPTVKISYLSKSVRGKDGRPSEILSLQGLLETIAKSKKGWKALENRNQIPSVDNPRQHKASQTPKYNYSEIIIEPKEGHALSRIISKHKEDYNLRLLKRIAPNQNLWLLTYDRKYIDPKDILSILKKEKGVKNVSFNKMTTDR